MSSQKSRAELMLNNHSQMYSGERLFMFEGRNLSINRSLAMFITMNPMYEFRNVLPSNLKVSLMNAGYWEYGMKETKRKYNVNFSCFDSKAASKPSKCRELPFQH